MTDQPQQPGHAGNSGAWQPVPGGGDYDPDQTMHVSFAAQLPPQPRPGEDPLVAHGPVGEPDAATTWSIPVMREDGESDSGEYSVGAFASPWDQAPSPAAPTQSFPAGMFGQGAAAAQAAQAQARAEAEAGLAEAGHTGTPWSAFGAPGAVPWTPVDPVAAEAAWSSVVDEVPDPAAEGHEAPRRHESAPQERAIDHAASEGVPDGPAEGVPPASPPASPLASPLAAPPGAEPQPLPDAALEGEPSPVPDTRPEPLPEHEPVAEAGGGHEAGHGPEAALEGEPGHGPQDPAGYAAGHGPEHGAEHSAGYDADHGPDHGTGYDAGHGPEQGAGYDAGHGPEHGAEHSAGYDAGHGAEHAAGYDADHGAGYDAGSEPAVDGGPGLDGEPDHDAEFAAGLSPAGDSRSEHPLASYVLRVNGTDRPVTDVWLGESLLYVLRERLGLAGAKDGCEQGECGACSVQVDGRLVASCLVPAATAAGSEVLTVEGLSADGRPSDIQQALADCGAVQCGFCIPGMAMTVHDLLEGNHHPTDLEARQALSGNLCRCSGYRGVIDAVRQVVGARDGEDPPPQSPRVPAQSGPTSPEAAV
jgi:aerobic-type carbon monoxide dehydrogenase small subunit (CoxS/CutS family)